MTDAETSNETRLGAVLQSLGVAQGRFAELTEQDTAVISKWVSGKREPRRQNKVTIMRALRQLGWQGTSVDLWPIDDDDFESSCSRSQ